MHVREPLVSPVDISELRPTQITVGMHEVRAKRESWQARKDKSEFLGRHMIPVILGPKERHYVIDQHHLARALHDEGQQHVLVSVVTDLRMLERDAFWVFLDNRGWCHPYDQKGVRRQFADIPKSVADLVDDPYRSLAGELRKAGGFAKDTTPFSEFLWADFLRRRIKKAAIKSDFNSALGEAMKLAKSPDAHFLPGWCGPVV
ncbi:MAG: ParB-like protein [Xanthobacteraceae bacterium]